MVCIKITMKLKRNCLYKRKINFKETIKRIDNKAVCEFDEFNTKDNCNKIIKYTLNKLLFAKDVNEKLRKD